MAEIIKFKTEKQAKKEVKNFIKNFGYEPGIFKASKKDDNFFFIVKPKDLEKINKR